MLTWTDWPARRRPLRATIAAAVIVLCALAIGAVDPWLGAIGLVLLVLATAEVLLPTRYALGPDGVEVRSVARVLRRPWDRFSGWVPSTEGFWLRGRGPRAWLRRRRGVGLRCPGQEDAVAAILRDHLQGAA